MRDPLVIGVDQPYSPAARYIGNSGPLQQWYETNFDPTSGFINRVEYKGMDWTRVQTLANYFTAQGISANLKNEHGVSTLTLTDATGTFVIDRWEMSVDQVSKSIFENPLFLSLINTAAKPSLAVSMMKVALKNSDQNSDDGNSNSAWDSLTQLKQPAADTWDATTGLPTHYAAATINKVAVNFINFALGQPFYGTAPGNDASIISPATNATGATLDWTSADMVKLRNYFDSYNYGSTDFITGKYSLRHTSNIPARWNVSVADFNVERIYTLSQLIAECTGSGFLLPLPNYLVYKILNYIPDPVISKTPWFIYGALKSKADAITAVNNRIELQTHYYIDNISSLVYSPI